MQVTSMLTGLAATTARTLRPYQQICTDLTVQAALATSKERNLYYSLPTGTGKTRVAAAILEKLLPYGRCLFVAHRKELITQAAASLREDLPGWDIGVIMADQCDLQADVMVCSIQTLAEGRLETILEHLAIVHVLQSTQGKNPVRHSRIVACLVDECHHAVSDNYYATMINRLHQVYPKAAVIGCTATPYRADSKVMQDVLPVCTFTRSVKEMQESHYLSPVTWRPVILSDLKLETVKLSKNGDYQEKSLVEVIGPQLGEIVRETYPLIKDRPAVIFAASVTHAKQLAEGYSILAGYTGQFGSTPPYMAIWGDMPKKDRDWILQQWQRGLIRGVCNYGILTEGFDYKPLAPNTDGLAAMVIARPTKSPALYMQMLGRGTRPKPGVFQDCLVVDVSGNANFLEAKQVTLPRVLLNFASDRLVEWLEQPPEYIDYQELDLLMEESQPSLKKARKPVKLKELDWQKRSWVAWGEHDGMYYTDTMNDTWLVCKPVASSGLYQGWLLSRTREQAEGEARARFTWQAPQSLCDRALPLHELMQLINLLVAKSGNKKILDKKAAWRSDLPKETQIKTLCRWDAKAGALAIQEHWNKGEVSNALTWAMIRGKVREL